MSDNQTRQPKFRAGERSAHRNPIRPCIQTYNPQQGAAEVTRSQRKVKGLAGKGFMPLVVNIESPDCSRATNKHMHHHLVINFYIYSFKPPY